MILVHMVIALIIGLVCTALFNQMCRRSGPSVSFLTFFLLVFFGAWAGGIWIIPIGPSVLGVYWIPFLIVGFIFALLLAATFPVCPLPPAADSYQTGLPQTRMRVIFNVVYWFVLMILIVSIILGYRRPELLLAS